MALHVPTPFQLSVLVSCGPFGESHKRGGSQPPTGTVPHVWGSLMGPVLRCGQGGLLLEAPAGGNLLVP